ncbi:putative diphthamide synthesis protein-domain-containing protein [Pilobolus umbonatus]|nr:putative diphthamide synthesis protein-domain-containing protein [Pilobolus umbonatus]
MTTTGPTNFADDGRDTIERTIEIKSSKHKNIEELYEIDRTIKSIKQGGYQRIALQFSDELLADAAAVANKLTEGTKKEIFVLADTSYGSCCVDEVAAEHVNADLIVHYGRSCLSPTSRISVLYVFGQQPLDTQHCIKEFKSLFPDKSKPVIIMCDVEYSYAVEHLTAELQKEYKNVIPTKIQSESLIHPVDTYKTCENSGDKGDKQCCGRCSHEIEDALGASSSKLSSVVPPAAPIEDVDRLKTEMKNGSRYFQLPAGLSTDECSIFFIGSESLTLTNIMMVYNKCPVYTYCPSTKEARKESVQVNKLLMKRYFLVQKAKDADTIGIVVGTLGVASYLNIIEHLKKLIKASGRKSYLFVMGKLNVAKMANFMEIDCYVLVACPENSLIDSKEFYRPIVTPFELEIALIRDREWTGDYITDFSRLLPQLRTDNFAYDMDKDDISSDEEPHFSLVTGQYKLGSLNRVKDAPKEDSGELLTSSLTDLTLRTKETSISMLLNSTAGEYLKNRTYRGLETNIGQDEAADVQEGLSGIARGYATEKNM